MGRTLNIFHWAPERIIFNFEKGLVAAVRKEFPNAIHYDCFFPFYAGDFPQRSNFGPANPLPMKRKHIIFPKNCACGIPTIRKI